MIIPPIVTFQIYFNECFECCVGPSKAGEDSQGQGGWLPMGNTVAATQVEPHDFTLPASHLQRFQFFGAHHSEQDCDLPGQQQALHRTVRPPSGEWIIELPHTHHK